MSAPKVNLVVLLLAHGEDPAKIMSIECALKYLARRCVEIYHDAQADGKECAAICIKARGYTCSENGIRLRMGRGKFLTISHEELCVAHIADDTYTLEANRYRLMA